jgi:uncharacterized RDD family membrane protein YckC
MKIDEATVRKSYQNLCTDELLTLLNEDNVDEQFAPILTEVLTERGIHQDDIEAHAEDNLAANVLLGQRSIEEISSGYSSKDIGFIRAAATIIDSFVLIIIIFLGIAISQWLQISRFEIPLIISVFSYFFFGERFFGKTLGKLALKITIVNKHGRKPSLYQVFTRTAARIIELNPCLIGGLPAFLFVAFTKSRQRLGDIIAGTYVIKDTDLQTLELENI